jgi:hypothetical protein
MSEVGRRRSLAIAAIAVLALTGLVFLLVDHEPEVRPIASPPERVLAAPAAAGLPAPMAPASPIAGDAIDLCGYGQVARSRADDIQLESRKASERALRRFASRLAASPNERETALGLLLQRSMISYPVLDQDEQSDPRCANSSDCGENKYGAAANNAAEIRNRLVRLAIGSRDSQVYAIALQSCNYVVGVGTGDACSLLSAARWAELEPDNAVPWLLLAGAAQATGNDAARDEAVYRASSAQRFDPHLPNFIGFLQSPDFRGESPQTRSALLDDVFGMEATRTALPYGTLLQYCGFPSVADATRVSVCRDLADLLLKQDPTLLGLTTGVKLAQSAGWSADSVKAWREEKNALLLAAQKAGAAQQTEREGGSCEELARGERWATDYAALGELGVARKFLKESGKAAARSYDLR